MAERDTRALVSAAWWPGTPPQQRQNLVAGRMLALPDGSWWLFGAWGRWYRWTPADGQWHLCPPPQLAITRMSARPLQQGMPVPPIPPHVVPTGPDLAYDPPAALAFVDAGIRPEVTARVRATVESAAALPPQDYPHWWGLFSSTTPSTVAVTWGVMLWCATSPVFDSRLDGQLLGLWSAYRSRPLASIDGPRWLTPPPLESLVGLYTERLRAGRVDAAVVILRTMWATASALREDVRFQPRADALISLLGATLQNPTVDYGALSYGDQAVVQQWLTRCPPSLAPALRVEASAGEHFRNLYYDLAVAVTPIAGDPSSRGYVEPRLVAAALLAADLAVVRQDVSSQVVGWLDPQVSEAMRAMLIQRDHPLRPFWPEGDRMPRPLREGMEAAVPSVRSTLLATMYGADLAWCRLGGGIPARPRGFPSSVAILAEIIGPDRATSAASSEPTSQAPGIAPLAHQYPSNPGRTPAVPLAQEPPAGPPGQAPSWAPPGATPPPSTQAWEGAQPWPSSSGPAGGPSGAGPAPRPPSTEAWDGAQPLPGGGSRSGAGPSGGGPAPRPPSTEAWDAAQPWPGGSAVPGTEGAAQPWPGPGGSPAGPAAPVPQPPSTEAWDAAQPWPGGPPAPGAEGAPRPWPGSGGSPAGSAAAGPAQPWPSSGGSPAGSAVPGAEGAAQPWPSASRMGSAASRPPATQAWDGTHPPPNTAEREPPRPPPATEAWQGSAEPTVRPPAGGAGPGTSEPTTHPPATEAWSGSEGRDASRPSPPPTQAWSGTGEHDDEDRPNTAGNESGGATSPPPATMAWSGSEGLEPLPESGARDAPSGETGPGSADEVGRDVPSPPVTVASFPAVETQLGTEGTDSPEPRSGPSDSGTAVPVTGEARPSASEPEPSAAADADAGDVGAVDADDLSADGGDADAGDTGDGDAGEGEGDQALPLPTASQTPPEGPVDRPVAGHDARVAVEDQTMLDANVAAGVQDRTMLDAGTAARHHVGGEVGDPGAAGEDAHDRTMLDSAVGAGAVGGADVDDDRTMLDAGTAAGHRVSGDPGAAREDVHDPTMLSQDAAGGVGEAGAAEVRHDPVMLGRDAAVGEAGAAEDRHDPTVLSRDAALAWGEPGTAEDRHDPTMLSRDGSEPGSAEDPHDPTMVSGGAEADVHEPTMLSAGAEGEPGHPSAADRHDPTMLSAGAGWEVSLPSVADRRDPTQSAAVVHEPTMLGEGPEAAVADPSGDRHDPTMLSASGEADKSIQHEPDDRTMLDAGGPAEEAADDTVEDDDRTGEDQTGDDTSEDLPTGEKIMDQQVNNATMMDPAAEVNSSTYVDWIGGTRADVGPIPIVAPAPLPAEPPRTRAAEPPRTRAVEEPQRPGTRILSSSDLMGMAPMPERPVEQIAPPPATAPLPRVAERFGIRFLSGADDATQLFDEMHRNAPSRVPALLIVGDPHTGQRRLTRLVARTLAGAGLGDGSVRTADGGELRGDHAATVTAILRGDTRNAPLLFERLDRAVLDAKDPARVVAAVTSTRDKRALIATCEPESYRLLAHRYPQLTRMFKVFRLPDLSRVETRLALMHVLTDERRVTINASGLEVVRGDLARLGGHGDLVGARLVEAYLDRAVARHTERAGAPRDRMVLVPVDFAGVAEEIEPVLRPPRDVDGFLRGLDEMIGLDEVKRTVGGLVAEARMAADRAMRGLPSGNPSRHLIFLGRPGTGKATVAGLIGGIYAALNLLDSGQLVVCNTRDFAGDTAAKVRAFVERAIGGILLIEEAHLLDRMAVEQLERLMAERRDKFMVICAGPPDEMEGFLLANPGFRAEFGAIVEFRDPTDRQLVQLFSRLAERDLYMLDEELRVELLDRFGGMRRYPGFAFADTVRRMFDQIVARQAARLAGAQVSAAAVARLSVGDLPPSEGGRLLQELHPNRLRRSPD